MPTISSIDTLNLRDPILNLRDSVSFRVEEYIPFEERNSMNQNYCVYIILVAKLFPLNVVFDKTSNSLLDS